MKLDVKIPLSVGEVARRSGITVATVHFYEKKRLINGWRSDGNQRRYSRDVLRKIAVIKIAQRAGVSLEAIKSALDELPSERTLTARDWSRLSAKWRDMLSERIRSLTELRDNLDGCIGCGCLSLKDCPLRNPGDRMSELGTGAVLLDASQTSAAARRSATRRV